MTFSIHCAFPAVLQNDWVIFSKADNATDLSSGVSLRVHANGSVELCVREHKYRPDVRMRTAAGVVTQGSEHHFTVSLGYEGAWFTVDGRHGGAGLQEHAGVVGSRSSPQRRRGSRTAVSTRVTNTSAIRLGRTGDQSTSADIVVTKFAVFYGGVARTTKDQQALGLTLADAQALAGASGPVLPDPRFSAVSQSPVAGANTIQAAIDAATPNGTVILSGSYTQSVDLVLKKGVRLTTSGGATITFTNDAKLTTAVPTAMPALTGGALRCRRADLLRHQLPYRRCRVRRGGQHRTRHALPGRRSAQSRSEKVGHDPAALAHCLGGNLHQSAVTNMSSSGRSRRSSLAGETLHALAKRHDLSRHLIRVWVAKYEAGGFDEDAEAADLIAGVRGQDRGAGADGRPAGAGDRVLKGGSAETHRGREARLRP